MCLSTSALVCVCFTVFLVVRSRATRHVEQVFAEFGWPFGHQMMREDEIR